MYRKTEDEAQTKIQVQSLSRCFLLPTNKRITLMV